LCLLSGVTFPPYYYGFYCDYKVRDIYLATGVFTCTLLSIINIFVPSKYKTAKFLSIIGCILGIAISIPMIHLITKSIIES